MDDGRWMLRLTMESVQSYAQQSPPSLSLHMENPPGSQGITNWIFILWADTQPYDKH